MRLFLFLLFFVFILMYHTTHIKKAIDIPIEPILITGTIVSLPIGNSLHRCFIFETETPFKAKINLSWYGYFKKLTVGDHWQLFVKLKLPHGLANPGGFNTEKWLMQSHVIATGTVIKNNHNLLLGAAHWRMPMRELRQILNDTLQKIGNDPMMPFMAALVLGIKNDISFSDWQILARTGTSHLMAISGLHVGLFFGFIYFLFSYLWKCSTRLCLFFPAPKASICIAWCGALFYSGIAGFSLPTQRALVMLTGIVLARLCDRFVSMWRILIIAFMLIVLLDPLALLNIGFWLSFACVATLIYTMQGRLRPSGVWWRWGRAQCVIALGLLPLSLLFFQQWSVISLLANMIAIPWVSFTVVPFALLGCLLLPLWHLGGFFFLMIATHSLAGCWWILTVLSAGSGSVWHHTLPMGIAWIFLMIGVLLLLAPRAFPARSLGIFYCLPALCYTPPHPADGNYWLSVLDVGQGLSAVIETAHHTLVFDTGPRFSTKLDAGNTVIMPYLASQGIYHIDMLVVSHGDSDHSGGVMSLLQWVPVTQILTSIPQQFSIPAIFCESGQSWVWDHVQFRFLYPTVLQRGLNNDSSCVLRVQAGEHAILLTGDIEKFAEHILLETERSALQADVIVAPHHGSRTSSTEDFVQAVFPKAVVFSTGYRNKFHFPHPAVVARYQHLGARVYNTAETGALIFKPAESLFPLTIRAKPE